MSGYNNPQEHQTFKGSASATNTADTQILAAPGVGFAWMVTTIAIYNSHASAGTGVTMKTASESWGPLPAPAANGGSIFNFPKPLPWPENEALKFAADAGVSTISVSVIAYKANAK